MEFILKANGSADIYDVTVSLRDNRIVIHCTCKASSQGMMCRHRAALLSEDAENEVIAEIFDRDGSFADAYASIQNSDLIKIHADHLKRLSALKKQLKQSENAEKHAFVRYLEGR